MRPSRVAALVLLAAASAVALAPPARAEDDAETRRVALVRGWIATLDDEDAERRNRAETELEALGEAARAELEAARPEARPEARRRIDALLGRLAAAARTAERFEWSGLRGGPQRSGVVGGDVPRAQPSLRWRVSIPDADPIQGALAAGEGMVVTLGAEGVVRALDAETGDRRWLAVLDAPVGASAAVGSGRVVVPTGGGVVALDAASGHVAWKVPAAYGSRAAPAIVGKRVFVALRNQGVYALDAASGDAVVERKMAPQGALLADADLLVVGAEDGTLHSLDPATGKDRWTVDLGETVLMGPTLAAPGVIVVFSKDRWIQALRVADGKRIWRLRTDALSASESISAAAGRVFTTDQLGFIHAYDAATGRELWNRCEGFVEMGAPAAGSTAVCFGSRGRVGCRDAQTGDFLWRIDVDRKECSSPIVAGGSVYVLDAGQIRCLR